MNNQESLSTLQASAQRALTGEVFSNLVALTCGLENQTIKLRAYFKGEVNEDDIERVQNVGTEIIADFPDGYMIDEECISTKERSPEILDVWIYRQ